MLFPLLRVERREPKIATPSTTHAETAGDCEGEAGGGGGEGRLAGKVGPESVELSGSPLGHEGGRGLHMTGCQCPPFPPSPQ